MIEYISFLSPLINSFIKFCQASERWNDSSYGINLKLFDRYCHENYPDEKELTQEMVDGWCKQRETEMNNSCLSRIYVVHSFVIFLNTRNLTTVKPPTLPRKEKRTYIPHAFTNEELERFFHECDNLVYDKNSKESVVRKMTIPVFYRLLYSSGIRTNEARLLLRKNVDLKNGILNIEYSKGHNQHYIVLHDSMTDIMKEYDRTIDGVVPDREYFFPSVRNGHFTKNWLVKNFKLIWYKVNTSYATSYEFRHNYAIENINKWIGYGFDFHDRLVYLSKSMGHTTIESTKYYYSIVPSLSEVLKKNTEDNTNWMIPEVPDEETY